MTWKNKLRKTGTSIEIMLHQILAKAKVFNYTSGEGTFTGPREAALLDFLIGGVINLENTNELHRTHKDQERMMQLAHKGILSFYTLDEAIRACHKALKVQTEGGPF